MGVGGSLVRCAVVQCCEGKMEILNSYGDSNDDDSSAENRTQIQNWN